MDNGYISTAVSHMSQRSNVVVHSYSAITMMFKGLCEDETIIEMI